MPSFDVVCEVDLQEIANAVDQANREISQRYDFKGSEARIDAKECILTIIAQDEFKVGQAREILLLKLTKRRVDIRGLVYREIEQGNQARQQITIQQGIENPMAKQMVKMIKSEKIKIQASIQGEQVRISGKKRDDLQSAMALLKGQYADSPLQFVNFRD